MKKNVLLVDDDYIFNFLNQAILEKIGITNEIYTALNGKEALNLLGYSSPARFIPDVILLDLNMPIMDGFGFLEAFKKLNLPEKDKMVIIVITSSEDPNDIMKAKRMGIDHYLPKPVSEKDLRHALEMK